MAPTPVPVPTTPPEPTTAPTAVPTPSEEGVTLRIMSDWGSAFPGQEINYTILLHNDRPIGSDALQDIAVQSTLPRNLEVVGASADRGNDPTMAGNDVRYRVDKLNAGETIEISVRTEIRPGVDPGTIMVSQAEALYEGLRRPLLSNIVKLQVLSEDQQPTATPSPTPTETPVAVAEAETATPAAAYPPPTTAATAATDTPAPAITSTPRAAGGVSPADTPTPKRNTVRTRTTPEGLVVPLPATSTGVPLAGFALLGLTLLTRTVRLHRASERL